MLAVKHFDSSSFPLPADFSPDIGMPWTGFLSGDNIARNSGDDMVAADENPKTRKSSLSLEGILAVNEILMADEGLARSVVAANWNSKPNQKPYLALFAYSGIGNLKAAPNVALFSDILAPYIFIEKAFENKIAADLNPAPAIQPFVSREISVERDIARNTATFDGFSSQFYANQARYQGNYSQKNEITPRYDNPTTHSLLPSIQIIQYSRQTYGRVSQEMPVNKPLQNYNIRLPNFGSVSRQADFKIAAPKIRQEDFKSYTDSSFVINYASKPAEMQRLPEIFMGFSQLKPDYELFSKKTPANNYRTNSNQIPQLKIYGTNMGVHDTKQTAYDSTLVAKVLGETNPGLHIPELQKSYAGRAANDNSKPYTLQHGLEHLIIDRPIKTGFRVDVAVANYASTRSLDNFVQSEFSNDNYKQTPKPFVDDDGKAVKDAYIAFEKFVDQKDLEKYKASNYLEFFKQVLTEAGYNVEIKAMNYKDPSLDKNVKGSILVDKDNPSMAFEFIVNNYLAEFKHGDENPYALMELSEGDHAKILWHKINMPKINSRELQTKSGKNCYN